MYGQLEGQEQARRFLEYWKPALESVAMIIPNVFAGRRVFLTGDSGFKGSWLAAWLYLLGAEVTGFSLPSPDKDNHSRSLHLETRIRHVDGDIRDLEQLRRILIETKPEFIFHLAAQALVLRSYRDPYETFETNVIGSVNLLEAVRKLESVRVLINVTSDKCYLNRGELSGFRESDPLGGMDPYSASKACAEFVFTAYQASFFSRESYPAAASVRAGNVIGGGDWADDRIVPDCVRALRLHKPLNIRNPRAIRPWQHVLEPLGGYLLLASCLYRKPCSGFGGAWNFGPDLDSHRPVNELVEEIGRNWGAITKTEIQQMPQQTYEAPTLYLNCDKAKTMLDWQPTWTFHEAVRHAVDWYKQYFSGANVWSLTTSQIRAFSNSMAQVSTSQQATASA
jgi:CDP-glucose 4,6-dehydratase